MSNNKAESKSELYTQRSMENLSSPDQLKDYLKVTGMPVWIVMIAIFVLLAGLIVWSTFATLTSYTSAKGIVKDGVLTVTMQDNARDGAVTGESGDERVCRIGDAQVILSVSGTNAKGDLIAAGSVSLPDGIYNVRIGHRQTKAIELLLN